VRVADLPVLTSRDRRALRSHVLAQLLEFDEQIATLTRSFDDIVEAAVQSNFDDEHDPEGTTIAFERQQVAALLRQAKADREALLLARDRIEQPGYGVCEYCKGFIGIERLLALPYAARCITCAS
jgi:RNA polymerase-binding transcription factor DksA